MLLTIFLAVVFCAAITLMLLSAVAFIQKKEFFSSAPKEAREAILPREKELTEKGADMLLTVFGTIVFCAAITLMLLSAVAFIQDKRFFSSAPKEVQEVIRPRENELFYGAKTSGWTLMVFSILMILGVGIISV